MKRVDDETATRSGAGAAAEGTRAGCAQPAWTPAGSARQQIGLGPARGGEHARTGGDAAQHALLGDRQGRHGGGEREAVVRDRGVCLLIATQNTRTYVPPWAYKRASWSTKLPIDIVAKHRAGPDRAGDHVMECSLDVKPGTKRHGAAVSRDDALLGRESGPRA